MKCPRHFPVFERVERQEGRTLTYYRCPQCKKVTKRSRKLPKQTIQKARKQMRARSPKRAAQEAEYNRDSAKFREENPICQRCHCRPSNQTHHLCGREGVWLLLREFWRAVCGECHDWIENNRAAAKATGWLLPRRPSK